MRTSKILVHHNVKFSMTTFAKKKQFHQNSYRTLGPEKSEAKVNEMQKSQHSLHNKNPQKQQLTASEIKNDRN